MIILITYHEKQVKATILGNYKVGISSEDAGVDDKMIVMIGNDLINLDQCKECGVWCSEDEELYGNGYCTKCASLCGYCELYFNGNDMYKIGESDVEDCCTDCADKHHPNFKKYSKAIDDLIEPNVDKGDVRVSFEYIGEGLSGDYTGDENDVPLMRFYIHKKEYVDDSSGIDHPDWNWAEVDCGSYCTQVPVGTPNDTLEKIALKILDEVKSDIMQGNSIKRQVEDLSYIDENFLTDKV